MAVNIYVFNTTKSDLRLNLNGYDVTCGNGVWSGYQPTVVSFAYTPGDYPQGLFGAKNSITANFRGLQGGYQYQLAITNPTTDLQLYVFYTYMVLAQTGALTGSSGSLSGVPFPGTFVSAI
jgi:hypothetical protein